MKHAILLILLILGGYFGWQYSKPAVKRILRKFSRKHTVFITSVVLAVFAALVVAFYNRAISLL